MLYSKIFSFTVVGNQFSFYHIHVLSTVEKYKEVNVEDLFCDHKNIKHQQYFKPFSLFISLANF